MGTLRVILIVLHIIAAGVWIAQAVADLAFGRVMRGSEGKPVELPLLMAQTRVLTVMGQVGGIGILLTGFGLIWVDGYSFLGIGGFTPNWLMVKQIVYLAAMGLAFVVLIPAQNRLRPQFIAAAKGTPKVTPEVRQLSERMMLTSRLINLLVLLNILLGVWKPF